MLKKLSVILLFVYASGAVSGELTREETLQKCDGYALSMVSTEYSRNLQVNNLPKDTAGHYGNPYLVNQTLVFKSDDKTKVVHPIQRLWPNYERIDPSRFYSASVKHCTSDKEVLLAFWSGGNCKDVCEAWAIAKFGELGELEQTKGLSYSEFTQHLR